MKSINLKRLILLNLPYFKIMKPKQNVKGGTDLDDFDFDDYGEDEPEADDLTADEAEDNEV